MKTYLYVLKVTLNFNGKKLGLFNKCYNVRDISMPFEKKGL